MRWCVRCVSCGGVEQTQLQSGHYETPEEFAADVRLVWNNALTYNEQDNEVHLLAKEFQAAFEQSYASVQAEWDRHKQLHPTPARPAAAAAATTNHAPDVAVAVAAAAAATSTTPTPTQVLEGGETKTEAEANTTAPTTTTPTTTTPPLQEVVETVETKTEETPNEEGKAQV